jgi:hypothetical protein
VEIYLLIGRVNVDGRINGEGKMESWGESFLSNDLLSKAALTKTSTHASLISGMVQRHLCSLLIPV